MPVDMRGNQTGSGLAGALRQLFTPEAVAAQEDIWERVLEEDNVRQASTVVRVRSRNARMDADNTSIHKSARKRVGT